MSSKYNNTSIEGILDIIESQQKEAQIIKYLCNSLYMYCKISLIVSVSTFIILIISIFFG